jgi:TAG lipase/lysophosphatidylethanolamine acyltransferase
MKAKAAPFLQHFQTLLLFVARLLTWCSAFFAPLFRGRLWRRRSTEKAVLSERLLMSSDYSQWVEIATALDQATGNGSWRANYSDALVNLRVLEESIAKMRQLRASGDSGALLRILQPCIARTHCGINNDRLFRDLRPALAGSKFIVEEFVSEMVSAIRFVAAQDCRMTSQLKLQWMLEARHSHGKTALLLSGGATFGLYHLGVVKALHRQGLLPKILAGSSAGSIMAALVATRANDEELEDLFEGHFSNATFSQAFDQKGSLRRKLTRFLTTGRLFDISKLSAILRTQLGDVTFLEAFNASGRILNVTVSPANSCDSGLLLNHITAPDVLVWSACRCVHCSISRYPNFFFHTSPQCVLRVPAPLRARSSAIQVSCRPNHPCSRFRCAHVRRLSLCRPSA